MGKSAVWYMDARFRRLMGSIAIKGRQVLEYSRWLDKFKLYDIRRVGRRKAPAYAGG